MRMSERFFVALCIAFMVNLAGCSPPEPGNSAPIARAGADQTVPMGTTVKLDGSASSDPDFDFLTYAWTLIVKPAGSTTTLVAATSAKPTITPDIAGSYVVSLTVNDGIVNSDPSTVTITAEQVHFFLFSTADDGIYLGCLTCDALDDESVCHPSGAYGSRFRTYSIWYQDGVFGSQLSPYSPWNSSGTIAPYIMRSDGIFHGYFTTNTSTFNRTRDPAFLGILDFFSSTLDIAATRAYVCGS